MGLPKLNLGLLELSSSLPELHQQQRCSGVAEVAYEVWNHFLVVFRRYLSAGSPVFVVHLLWKVFVFTTSPEDIKVGRVTGSWV